MKFFKKLHVYTLFYIGDIISRTIMDWWGWGYNWYNKCMVKSSELQDKYGLDKPWTTIKK